jgi:glucose/arabinose dehydrogenase
MNIGSPRLPLAVVLALTLAVLSPPVPAVAQNGLALDTVEVIDELVFPVALVDPGDGSARQFVVQQTGEILIWNGVSIEATPFLDLSDQLICCNERGLLGFAVHPDFATNGELFVHYTRPVDGLQSVVSRFTVSADDPDRADPASEEILFVLDQPRNNHNGGHLQFGPDGYLYAATGDGGGGGDPLENAQDRSNLHGNLLRLDVDSAPHPGLAYAVPADNPFVGVAGVREEIWSYGLRNPWRFSFDRQTGDLWIGDVGQGLWEEVSFQPASSPGGENYGWDCREGAHDYADGNGDQNQTCTGTGYTDPVLEYLHENGRCSVTGGFRYRGDVYPRLRGVYLYADFCTGELFGTVPRCDGVWQSRLLADTSFFISTFAEDSTGELYVAQRVGTGDPSSKFHRLVLAPGSDGPDLEPASQTLDFGTVEVGDTVALALGLTNANPGPEAARIDRVTVSAPGQITLGGTWSGPIACRSAAGPCMAPSAGCGQRVTLRADSPGSLSETVVFAGNFQPETVTVTAEVVECSSAVNLELSDATVSGTETHRACDTLTATVDVAGTGDLTLRAGTRIVLEDGFSVATGARLTLAIF